MLRFLVPFIFVVTSATPLQERSPRYRNPHLPNPRGQVASESQVKFALESKYDNTGPGARQPEYAYNTYKTLDEALVGYLNDPDTKLPEHERAKAIKKLTQSQYYNTRDVGKLFHRHGNLKLFEKLQFRPLNQEVVAYNFPRGKLYLTEDTEAVPGFKGQEDNDFGYYQNNKKSQPFKFQKFHTVKGSSVSLAHYARDPDLQLAHEQFDPHPKYSFSYGVNDKTTGDSKSAQESRDGGTVHGFYSFIDADGKTRTVHYTADDQLGFRADVKKSL